MLTSRNAVRGIAKPNLARCLLALFLPLILLVPAIIISNASGYTLYDYYNRLLDKPPLMAKAVMNGILGIIGITLWACYMLRPAVRSLCHWNDFIVENDGVLICLGRPICEFNNIESAHLRSRFMEKQLIIKSRGGEIEAVDIAMCQDIDSAIWDLNHRHYDDSTPD